MPARRYAELLPQELEQQWSTKAPAVWPIGALEWHGPHLPLGLDGIVAEALAERLAAETNGVLLPTCWLPITTLPHPHSLQIRTEAFRMILDDQLGGLYRAGARSIAVITGHYAQGHELELYEAAERAMDRHADLFVAAATPLELLSDEGLLDHAGRWETAQLLTIRPDLVHLQNLPEAIEPKQHAVLGGDPRAATAEDGAEVLTRGLKAWNELLARADREEIRRFYASRAEDYRPYRERFYRESWEQAIQDWWETK